MDKRFKILAGIIACVIFLAIFFGTMYYSVGTGYAAILVNPLSGSISEPIVGPVWGVKAPWMSVVHVYIATDTLGMWGDRVLGYPGTPLRHR